MAPGPALLAAALVCASWLTAQLTYRDLPIRHALQLGPPDVLGVSEPAEFVLARMA